MVPAPERENIAPPVDVIHQPDVIQIPEHIEQAGVSVTPSQTPVQISINKGQPVIGDESFQSPLPAVSITLPEPQAQLVSESQGSPDDSKTWNAFFWLRTIKKALHFGWKVIAGVATP